MIIFFGAMLAYFIISSCYEILKRDFPNCYNYIVGFFSYIFSAEFIVPLIIYGWCCLGGIICIGFHLFAMGFILIGDKSLDLKRGHPLVVSYIVSIILTIILTATGVIETN